MSARDLFKAKVLEAAQESREIGYVPTRMEAMIQESHPIKAMVSATASTNWQQTGIHTALTAEEILAINQRKNLPGILFFVGHFSLMLLTGYAFYLALETLWAIPLCILHGIVIVYWFQPFHECSHKTAYKTPWMNTAVYWFTALISILEPTHFYCEHIQHHRYTQHPEIDPERIPQADYFWGYVLYLTALPYFCYQLKGLFSHFAGRISDFEKAFIPVSKRAKVIREARLIVFFYAALVLASIILQTWFLVLFWLLPRVVGEPFMRMVRLTEHQGCPLVPDLFRNTRTVVAISPLKYLGWNACFHAEHHISPNTPFHAMPVLHNKILQRMENVENGYLKTHRKIAADNRADLLPRTQ